MHEQRKKLHYAADVIPLPTTGRAFSDGKAIEPVRDSTNPEKLRLLFWDGKKASIGSKIICDGQSYEPAPIHPTILRALTLPTGIVPCGSPRNLLADISKVVTEYTGFPENSVAAISRWMMSNWFPELQPAPGLSLIGPDTTAGRQQFQLLHCFCRHPLLLTQVSAAGLRKLPMEWGLTLLISQPKLSVAVEQLLSIGRTCIGFIPAGGHLLDLQCGLATYLETGRASGSGMIPSLEISVIPSRRSLPVLDQTVQEKIANDFQPKLLSYRLAHYAKVLNSAFNVPELTPSMQHLAQNLGACTPDDPDLQAQIPELLRAQDQDIRSATWLDIDTVIIETVLAAIHEGRKCIYVGEVTKGAEAILWGRGENQELSPKETGTRLRLLRLVPEPRNKKGIRLRLTTELSRRTHELACNLMVPSILDGAQRCSLLARHDQKKPYQKRNAMRKE